jgi:hypothetical protein
VRQRTHHSIFTAGFGRRTLFRLFLVGALLLTSAFSVKAHDCASAHGSAAQAIEQIAGGTPDEPSSGTDADHACHCTCQHFTGLIIIAEWMPEPFLAASKVEAGYSGPVPSSPATPHRPPKA